MIETTDLSKKEKIKGKKKKESPRRRSISTSQYGSRQNTALKKKKVDRGHAITHQLRDAKWKKGHCVREKPNVERRTGKERG